MTDDKLIQALAGAIEATRAHMDRKRDAIPRSKREPYFDKLDRRTGKPIIGYRTKLLEAQAKAVLEVFRAEASKP